MRVFVAAEVFERDIINGIRDAQEGMKLAGKAVEPHNLHFTIRFLGDADRQQVSEIGNALRTVRFTAFDVVLRGIGLFGSTRYPRVVWAGTDQMGGEALRGLACKVDDVLERIGWHKDRPFRPHLTILRVKRGEALGDLANHKDRVWGTQRVESIKLKQSVLGKAGPVYTDLVEVESARTL